MTRPRNRLLFTAEHATGNRADLDAVCLTDPSALTEALQQRLAFVRSSLAPWTAALCSSRTPDTPDGRWLTCPGRPMRPGSGRLGRGRPDTGSAVLWISTCTSHRPGWIGSRGRGCCWSRCITPSISRCPGSRWHLDLARAARATLLGQSG